MSAGDDSAVRTLRRHLAQGRRVLFPDDVFDGEGRIVGTTLRDVDLVFAEADARLAAAKEIAACATPQEAAE